MGNLFSKKDNHYTDLEIQRLKERLINLERADTNNDGVITKDEINTWMEQQKQDFEDYKLIVEKQVEEKYSNILTSKTEEIISAKNEIKELNKEIEALKKINDNLQKEILNKPLVLSNSTSGINITTSDLKEISKSKINELVDEILKDENLNIKYLPDYVEKRIYRNVFTMVLGLMDHLVDTTSVNFFGHKLIFDLVPQDN